MTLSDIFLLVATVIGLILLGLYFLNRWAGKKYDSQQVLIDKAKVTTTIFVLSKKKMWLKDVKFPKPVTQSIPWFYKLLKLPVVQAKIGNQIMCLICEKKVFKTIELKKNSKVELAGIYILGYAGQKNSKNSSDKNNKADNKNKLGRNKKNQS